MATPETSPGSGAPAVIGAQQRTDLAVLWMFGTIASFLVMAVAVREVSAEISAFQLLFVRSLMGVAIVGALIAARDLALLRSRRPGLQILRNLVHYVGQYAWVYALGVIPIAQVFAIEFTSPLWVALLAPLLLGERFVARRLLAVLLGFAGILLVLRPGAVPLSQGALVMLVGALGFALSLLAVKRLTGHDAPLTIILWMSGVQALIGLGPALAGWIWPAPVDWPWMLVVALGGLGAHYCLSRAFLHAEATLVAPVDFLRLPLAMLFGWLLYEEAADLWLVAGTALIVAGNWVGLRAPATRPAASAATSRADR